MKTVSVVKMNREISKLKNKLDYTESFVNYYMNEVGYWKQMYIQQMTIFVPLLDGVYYSEKEELILELIYFPETELTYFKSDSGSTVRFFSLEKSKEMLGNLTYIGRV